MIFSRSKNNLKNLTSVRFTKFYTSWFLEVNSGLNNLFRLIFYVKIAMTIICEIIIPCIDWEFITFINFWLPIIMFFRFTRFSHIVIHCSNKIRYFFDLIDSYSTLAIWTEYKSILIGVLPIDFYLDYVDTNFKLTGTPYLSIGMFIARGW